ncbi:MAG: Zn-dependent exopeptidase M28 [Candidatus Hydrogenedentes bacterium]|nr:Zn-dependent exopeptidase M28 [Candidatus Hydrogenedentota bacterium]
MSGGAAIKAILFMGVLVFLVLALTSIGLKKGLKPNPRERVAIRQKYSPFDSTRAYKDLERMVALGPRITGSEAAAQTRELLKGDLSRAGLRTWEHSFDAQTPAGPRKMVNLVAVVEGSRPGVILFGAHYDTKQLPGSASCAGANDGGSTTAWLLEWARALGAKREGRSLWLVWFDGEESFGEWSETDSLYGSRAFVEHLKSTGELEQIHAMINLEMIGDCYLRIMRDMEAPEWLAGTVWDTAERLGYGAHFSNLGRDIEDDHLPFRRTNVPALLLIDFVYGGSVLDHKRNWHTDQDTLDKVCPESLQALADVLYHALPAIDGHLDSLGTPRS